MKRNFGWRPDKPDARDHVYKVQRFKAGLPKKVDLRKYMPPVYDQGELGSCTANAIGASVEYEMRRIGRADFVPSRLQIYYCERAMEGTVRSDAGAEIRDGIKVINKVGAAHESLWPYDIGKFTKKPPKAVFTDAGLTRSVSYERVVPTLNNIKATLAAGKPIVFGFSVYESFESDEVARTGKMPVPKPGERMLGGHCVVLTGYDDRKAGGVGVGRNSWGEDWGMGGYFYMPYEVLANPDMCGDFWTSSFS